MKTTNSLRRAMVIALMSINITSYGEIVPFSGTSGYVGLDYEYYENDLDIECYINTNTYQPVTIWYNHDAENFYDYMIIYQINQNGTETELAYIDYAQSGSVSTTVPNGKAKVCIYTDGSCSYADGYADGTGFSFSWQVVSSFSYPNDETEVISKNATVAGNLGVGVVFPQTRLHVNGPIRGNGAAGSLTVSTTYGNVTMGATNSSQVTFSTDKSVYTFDKTLQLNNGILRSPYNTNLLFQTSGTTRMTISGSNNYVGIGTETPTQALSVKGNLSISPSGTTPKETYNGSLMITRPTTKNQFINLVKGSTAWSIGIKNDNYAVGMAKVADGTFSPSLVISSDKKVGIGTETLTQSLNVKGVLSLSPSGTTPNEGFQGSIMITRPNESKQYINLVNSVMPWSIGMIHSNHFAIGQGRPNEAEFTAPPFVISPDGNVGIGNTSPQYLLDVKGIIRATEVKIQSIDQFADFVFAKDYALPTLREVDSFIQANGHLPDVPSAADVKENGINLVEMQVKLLQKVEELTLYTIEQQKMIEQQTRMMAQQQQLIDAQKEAFKSQQERLDALENTLKK